MNKKPIYGLAAVLIAALVGWFFFMNQPDSGAEPVHIIGAGASFPYPAYAAWSSRYKQETGTDLNYQSIGSGGGIAQIRAGTVTFGASDMPMSGEELETQNLVQFPTLMGAVVPVINVEGIKAGELVLDGPLLAQIYLGTVRRWNDPAIQKLNPGLSLPGQAITVVHRSDGSGTTHIFTSYLSEVSAAWKKDVSAATAVKWPLGMGAKGNEGVANNVARSSGAIGYVEYAYAKTNGLTHAQMLNKSGEAVSPSLESIALAAQHADWAGADHFAVELLNRDGEGVWPIVSATFILVHKNRDSEATHAALAFFDWAFAHGDEAAEKLDYVPLPDDVVTMIKTVWEKDIEGYLPSTPAPQTSESSGPVTEPQN